MKRKTIELFEGEKTLDKCLDEFILNCEVKNLRPATIKFYKDYINIFFKFMPYKTLASEINKETIDNYILYLKNKTNENDRTINSNLNAIRSFFKFCQKLGYIEKFNIPKIKADKSIIIPYTDQELEILLKKPNLQKTTFANYRCWCIINFLIGTGCRCSNVIELKVKDVDIDNKYITFEHTKNRKPQIIPMSNSLSRVLKEYLKFRKPKNPDDYFFCTSYGKRISRRQLESDLTKYNRKRGVMKTGIHRFRHTFAKKWIMANGDIYRLQQILNHSSQDMTRKYVELFASDLQKDFNTFNPLEQLQKNHISMK